MAPKKPAPEPPPKEIADRIRAEWPTILVPLMKVACKACRNKEQVEDLVNDALVAILGGAHVWDPKTDPDLTAFAGSVINSLSANQRRRAHILRELLSRGDDDDVEDAAPSSRNPDRLTIDKSEEIRWKKIEARLAERFEPDDKAHPYLALVQRGTTAVLDQAEALGLTVDRTKYLRKRIRAMIQELAEEIA
jgi:DNA-directed RNA polymerase specialized sigma24 family protein